MENLTDGSAELTGRLPAPRRILLVTGDDREAERLGAVLLDAWPQFEIGRVHSLPDAVDRLAGGLECLVLDTGVLGDDQADELRALRAHDAELPIVVLVDSDAGGQGEEAIRAGVHDYLIKGTMDGADIARAIRLSIQRSRAERLSRELALVRFQNAETARVQRGLIPRLIIEDERISTRSAYRPGDRRQVLGGDFFDVIQSSPTRLQVVLGDVCGHGPDEAALGVQLRIAWRTLILAGVEQPQLLITLDRLAARERHAEHIYVTLASIDIDLDKGAARVGLAGHPPPIFTDGRAVRLLTEHGSGPPLGLNLPPLWELHDVQLGDAWTLLLYSDGLYEGHVAAKGTRLEIEGLLELLSSEGPEALWTAAPNRLLDEVEALNEGPLEDDVALLAVRFSGLIG